MFSAKEFSEALSIFKTSFSKGGSIKETREEALKKLYSKVKKNPYFLKPDIINGNAVYRIIKRTVFDYSAYSPYIITRDLGYAKTKKQSLSHIRHLEKVETEVKRKEL